MNFNIIGFNFPRKYYKWQEGFDYPEPVPQKTCVIHPGVLVVQMKGKDQDLLFCRECGTQYKEDDTLSEENFVPESGPTSNTIIISGKNKKKKYYDKQGNLITDPTLIQDIQQGKTVISYREDKADSTKQVKHRRLR
jgi:hypothetical protein